MTPGLSLATLTPSTQDARPRSPLEDPLTVSTRSPRVCAALLVALLGTVISAPVPAQADGPAALAATDASVAIISPVPDATVKGVMTITVVGRFTPTGEDIRSVIYLTVSDKEAGYGDDVENTKVADCSMADTDPDPATCRVTFTWDTHHLQDPETLRADFSLYPASTTGVTVTTIERIHVLHETHTWLQKTHTLTPGKPFRAQGRVSTPVYLFGAKPQVRVTYKPAVGGPAHSVVVTTDASGTFWAQFIAVAGGTLSAEALPSQIFGESKTAEPVMSSAAIRCAMTPKVVRNAVAKGVCVIPYLRKGDRIGFQVRAAYRWANIGTARSRTAGGVAFSFRFRDKGTFRLRLVMAGHDSFVQTISKPITVVVT